MKRQAAVIVTAPSHPGHPGLARFQLGPRPSALAGQCSLVQGKKILRTVSWELAPDRRQRAGPPSLRGLATSGHNCPRRPLLSHSVTPGTFLLGPSAGVHALWVLPDLPRPQWEFRGRVQPGAPPVPSSVARFAFFFDSGCNMTRVH